jgi:hypothetical protein
MTSHNDPAPVRLQSSPPDDRLAIRRVDRPPMNAFDQRMWISSPDPNSRRTS